MSGHLCLKWNNHAIAFNKLLDKIFLEDIYADGTILCQGKFYPVHRFVLSTCSEYFEEMFRQCVRLNNKHPFIIVKDIHPDQMEALLNYMYKGEVNVPQDMLPELIKAAEAFKIKGLAVPDEEPSPPRQSRKRAHISSPSSIPKKNKRLEERANSIESESYVDTNSGNSENTDNNQSLYTKESNQSVPGTSTSGNEIFISEPNYTKIKSEPVDSEEPVGIVEISPSKNEQEFKSFQEDDINFEAFPYNASDDNYTEGQESTSWDNSQPFEEEYSIENNPTERIVVVPSMFPSAESPLVQQPVKDRKDSVLQSCPFPGCSYTTTYAGHIKRHFRKHTGEKPFECPQCPYRASQKNNLDCHLSSVHLSEKPFQCPHCPYKSGHKGALKTHVFSRHKDIMSVPE